MEQQSQPKGVLIPLSPPRTPWKSEIKAVTDRVPNSDHDEGVNIQVIIRCRPLSKEEEVEEQAPVAISCDQQRREVSLIFNGVNKHINRTFIFDKVFGPTCGQEDFYHAALFPFVNEVLEGYNGTVFAYGQTGTGKTYTLEGGTRVQGTSDLEGDAGVIPRAVEQIFNILEAEKADYSIKVTYLELYNEEITDLLAQDECLLKKPIALLEDGKGNVLVRGLEEELVCSPGDIYKILEKGKGRKHTAETRVAKESSRAHSILSVLITIREYTGYEGHEFVKSAKLNLVDLAGSENVHRSGARESTSLKNHTSAREAGEINKSLLTLGRVITALSEHSEHVPYRDSKLTRLLRDSLGGKTKTCVIATLSTSTHCLDETLNTLDYARHAKNIRNRPQVNQKILQSTLITGTHKEMDHPSRGNKKGVCHIPQGTFQSVVSEKKAVAEELEHKERDSAMNNKGRVEVQEVHSYQKKWIDALGPKLETIQKAYEQTQCAFFDLEENRLRGMEDNVQLFLSEKAKATEEFKGRKLYENSQLALGSIRSQVTQHSSSVADELRNIALEIGSLLNDVQRTLHNQEKSLAAHLHQKNEIQSTRSQAPNLISEIAVNFFESMNTHASNLTHAMKDAELNNEYKFFDLEEKFEEFAANEERQLMEHVAQLLASSNATKKRLLQGAINSLRESSTRRSCKLKLEMTRMQDSISSFRGEWATQVKQMENLTRTKDPL